MESKYSDTAVQTEEASSTIIVDLLGTRFPITADESPEYLESLVLELRDRTTRIFEGTKVRDPLRLAILAGIVLLDELKHAKGSREGTDTVLASLDRRLHEAGL